MPNQNVSLDVATIDELKDVAYVEDSSVAEVIRTAVAEHLAELRDNREHIARRRKRGQRLLTQ